MRLSKLVLMASLCILPQLSFAQDKLCRHKDVEIVYAKTVKTMQNGFQHVRDFSKNTTILFDLRIFDENQRSKIKIHMRNVHTDILVYFYDVNGNYISQTTMLKSHPEKLYELPKGTAFFMEVPLTHSQYKNKKYIEQNIPKQLKLISCQI